MGRFKHGPIRKPTFIWTILTPFILAPAKRFHDNQIGVLVLTNTSYHQPKAQNRQNIYHRLVVSLNFEDAIDRLKSELT